MHHNIYKKNILYSQNKYKKKYPYLKLKAEGKKKESPSGHWTKTFDCVATVYKNNKSVYRSAGTFCFH